MTTRPQTGTGATSPGVLAPLKRIANLGIPFVIGSVAAAVSGIIDAAMMGRFGDTELAAVAASSAVFDVFVNLVLASMVGHQILAARFAGRDDPGAVGRSMRTAGRLSLGLAGLFVALVVVFGGSLVGLISSDPAHQAIGADYMMARSPTLLLVVAYALVAAVLNAFENPRPAVVAGIIISALNIFFDVLLIYGPGPFPRLGAVGNGLSTTLAWLIGVAFLLAVATHHPLARAIGRRPEPGPVDFETSNTRLIWPAMSSALLDYASIVIFFAIIGSAGQADLAGGRIAFEILLLLFTLWSAFAAAGRILVGRSAGAQNWNDLGLYWRIGQGAMVVGGLAVGAVLAFGAEWVARIFTPSADIISSTVPAVIWVGLSLPLLGYTLANSGVLRALGRTKAEMISNVGPMLAVQLPVSWVLVNRFDLGVSGAFVGVLGYWIVRAVFTEIQSRRAVIEEQRSQQSPKDVKVS